MKVGVLGTGGVGKALGGALHKSGFAVKYGSRNPASDKVKTILSEQPGTTADTNAEVVAWADAIILAITSPNTKADVKGMAELVRGAVGKPVIDATNPFTSTFDIALEDGGRDTSVGQELQLQVGESVSIYKAFNTIGLQHFEDPTLIHPNLMMMYAGPTDHQDMVEEIIKGVHFKPQRVGPIRYARNLEAIAELWIHMVVPPIPHTDVKLGPNFAFEMVFKE